MMNYCSGAAVVLCFISLSMFNYFCFSVLSFTGFEALAAVASTAIVVVTLHCTLLSDYLSADNHCSVTLLFMCLFKQIIVVFYYC